MSADVDPQRIGVFSLGQVMQQAPWRFALTHDRPADLLLWFTRGQGRVVINGVRRGVSLQNAIFLPAGTLFSVDPGPQSLVLAVSSPAGLTDRLPSEPVHLRVRDSLAQAELTGEIEAMQRELSRDRPMLQDALEAHVRLLAVWLQRQLVAGAADAPRDSAGNRLVRRYARAVVAGFRSDRNLNDYAEALDVTPTHLTRVCRAASGRTAAEILSERKLHEARRLLLAPDPPVNRIAEALGFHSAPYFTRFIRNHTGKSPTELRRMPDRLQPGERRVF